MQPVLLDLSRHFLCLLRFPQGQEETIILWFCRNALRSGGPVQERHADPQFKGDPENQRQKSEALRYGDV